MSKSCCAGCELPSIRIRRKQDVLVSIWTHVRFVVLSCDTADARGLEAVNGGTKVVLIDAKGNATSFHGCPLYITPIQPP
jgi:hypothetical protein